MIDDKITETIIGCAYTVANTLGCGFLEKVYENALVIELKKHNLKVKQQSPIKIKYDDIVVGEYVADLLVEDSVIIELKAVEKLNEVFKAQTLNYLKATKLDTALLINFGNPKIEIRRFFGFNIK